MNYYLEIILNPLGLSRKNLITLLDPTKVKEMAGPAFDLSHGISAEVTVLSF
jgi:hypothetical protein